MLVLRLAFYILKFRYFHLSHVCIDELLFVKVLLESEKKKLKMKIFIEENKKKIKIFKYLEFFLQNHFREVTKMVKHYLFFFKTNTSLKL